MKQAFNERDLQTYIQKQYPLIYKVNLDLAKIRTFTDSEIKCLCEELRQFITEQVTLNGGHLASNLGVVELTVALLRNFDFTKDRLIWDVGHQCYAWKILTYRANSFAHFRQKNGLAGFPKPDESVYDHFATGHATTSISAALGMAAALQAQGSDRKVIAVIGDGALTGGMAWEALNNIRDLAPNLLIILNDNTMSIDKNVGFVARELRKLRLSSNYLQFKSKIKNRLNSYGSFGQTVVKFCRGSKAKLRAYLGNTREFFCERYGCRYYGPLDGHDIKQLEYSFQALQDFHRPALLHILTEKGHGYGPAMADPVGFHGLRAYDRRLIADDVLEPMSSKETEEKLTYTKAFGQTIMQLAPNHEFVCITAAMASGTGLSSFANNYRERFYDVGIAEQHAVCFAAGLVSQGMKTVCAIYDTFLQRALDAVLHDVCLQNLPLILAIDRAGLVGEDGATHQGIYSLAFLVGLPNLKILNLSDPYMLQSFLKQAIEQKLTYPLALRYPKDCITLPDFLLKSNLATYDLNRTYANVYSFEKQFASELTKPELNLLFNDWRKTKTKDDMQACLASHNYKMATYTLATDDHDNLLDSYLPHAHKLTILTSGRLLTNCLEAILDLITHEELREAITLFDCYDYSLTLQALQADSSEINQYIKESDHVLILEESSGASPLFAALANNFARPTSQTVVVKNLGNALIEQGKVLEQLADFGLDTAGIKESILNVFNPNSSGKR